MTTQDLYRVPSTRAGGDALRTLSLILATVLVALIVTATVPDSVWSELSAAEDSGLPDWHGNVAAHASR